MSNGDAKNIKEKYMTQLDGLKDNVKLKAILASDDGGKTWFVQQQFYVSNADFSHEQYDFAGIDLQGLPLKTDLEH